MKERNKENVTAIYTIIRTNGKKETIKGAGGFTHNYNKIRYGLITIRGIELVDKNGASFYFRPWEYPVRYIRLDAPARTSSFGLVLGTNDAPYSFEDYSINIIPHGTEPGQIYYDNSTARILPQDPSILEIKRWFKNESTGGIIVRESGLIANVLAANGTADILIARDVPDSAILLYPGDTLIITYELKV